MKTKHDLYTGNNKIISDPDTVFDTQRNQFLRENFPLYSYVFVNTNNEAYRETLRAI